MGYSTVEIAPNKIQVRNMLYGKYEVTEARNAHYFTSKSWWRRIVKLEKTDHNTPRFICTLDCGDFVELQIKE